MAGTAAAAAIAPNLSAEYVRGPDLGGGVGGLLYSLRPRPGGGSLAPAYLHYNRRGDMIGETNAAGVVAYTAAYEAFGRQTTRYGTTKDRQRANTKEEDPTGLLNEGQRYRDLEAGVFITRDPAGFVDGPNLYAYVRQNPWTKWDPEGLLSDMSAEDARIIGQVGLGAPLRAAGDALKWVYSTTVQLPDDQSAAGLEKVQARPQPRPGLARPAGAVLEEVAGVHARGEEGVLVAGRCSAARSQRKRAGSR